MVPLIMNASQCKWCEWHKVQCDVAWPIVCQGHHDKKIILLNVKHAVEDATPGRGKNTKAVGLPCIWGMVLAQRLPQRGKPKLRYSGKEARVRFLTGQREDDGLLFTGSIPD